MSGKVYRGRRMHNGCEVKVLENGKVARILTTYSYHSRVIDWGGGGSGSSELALAVLLDYFDELPSAANLYLGQTKAQLYTQDFKWAFIAGIVTTTWEISEDQIDGWLEARGLAATLFGGSVQVGK